MIKKLLALMAAMLLLGGCSNAWTPKYPWVGDDQPVVAAQELRLILPETVDEPLANALIMLEAKLLELSNDKITVVRENSENPLELYQADEPGLYLLTSAEMEKLDPDLSVFRLPFLFQESDKLMNILNSETGAVRGSRNTRKRVGGEIIGAYYAGSSWMLSTLPFEQEIGFAGNVGMLKEGLDNSVLAELGAAAVVEDNFDSLMDSLAEGELQYCEVQPGIEPPQEAVQAIKSIEPTNHRYNALWLVFQNPQVKPEERTSDYIREAFACTIEKQVNDRQEQEKRQLSDLQTRCGVEANQTDAYTEIKKAARSYYRANYRNLGISQEMWERYFQMLW